MFSNAYIRDLGTISLTFLDKFSQEISINCTNVKVCEDKHIKFYLKCLVRFTKKWKVFYIGIHRTLM